MMKFFDYMKKHNVWTEEEYDYVKFKELFLNDDIQVNGTRKGPQR